MFLFLNFSKYPLTLTPLDPSRATNQPEKYLNLFSFFFLFLKKSFIFVLLKSIKKYSLLHHEIKELNR